MDGAVGDYSTDLLLARSMETAEKALKEASASNIKESEEILTAVGEYIIRDKAQDVIRELPYVLPKQKPYNYAQLRRDPKLRRIAVQTIQTPRGRWAIRIFMTRMAISSFTRPECGRP